MTFLTIWMIFPSNWRINHFSEINIQAFDEGLCNFFFIFTLVFFVDSFRIIGIETLKSLLKQCIWYFLEKIIHKFFVFLLTFNLIPIFMLMLAPFVASDSALMTYFAATNSTLSNSAFSHSNILVWLIGGFLYHQ